MSEAMPALSERNASGHSVKGPSQGQTKGPSQGRLLRSSTVDSRESSLDSVAERRDLDMGGMQMETAPVRAVAASVSGVAGGVRRKRPLAPVFVSGVTDSDDTETDGLTAAKVPAARRGRPAKAGHTRGELLKPQSTGSDEELAKILRSRKLKKGANTADVAGTLDPGSESDIQLVFGDMSTMNAEELRAQAGGMLACILEVARKSGNLKGEYVGRLKRSASTLREVVDTLASRSEAEETRCLRATNNRLKMEVEALQVELTGLRKAFGDARAEVAAANTAAATGGELRPLPAPGMAVAIEELRGSLTATLGQMISARIEALEDRLLPAPIVRPPLQADVRRVAAAAALPKPSSAMARPPASKAGNKKPAATPEVDSVAGPSGMKKPSGAAPPAVAQDESWTTVVRKAKGKGKGKGKSSLLQATPAPASRAPAPAAKPKAAPKTAPKQKVVLKTPSSAAVVLALQPEAAQRGVTYSAVLMKAQAAVDLKELGIDQLRYRQTATGARMLEIPGSQNSDKADRLADKLRTVLSDEVSVVRPIKSTDLSVTGLDDATTEEGLAKIVAEAGRCDVRLVKVGRIRRGIGNGGAGSTIVSCPVSAAKVLLEGGRILVGWSSVRVTALGNRPMRCYRCMGLGHTRPQCTATVDRGDLCFRCGDTGHKAATCHRAEPRCAICAESGRPYRHKMGGRSCVPPKTKGQAPRSPGGIPAAIPRVVRRESSASEIMMSD